MNKLEKKNIILWPVYFDLKKTRSEGRRVPRSLAIKSPSIDELAKAAERAGYDIKIDRDAKYPAFWFEEPGRIIVYTEEPKTTVIRRVAEILVKNFRRKKQVSS